MMKGTIPMSSEGLQKMIQKFEETSSFYVNFEREGLDVSGISEVLDVKKMLCRNSSASRKRFFAHSPLHGAILS
ncbi:hypothetical protein TNCT_100371 [Trichonephila clavata]|uniref:Uncharacterized protein n=1 Tax=Trichonephila clavata TaxID=2740835 RepID=A0A8X6GQD0_TRICU|nr:hypothetical protein TNCT_100371 [Trichonephila clavata]